MPTHYSPTGVQVVVDQNLPGPALPSSTNGSLPAQAFENENPAPSADEIIDDAFPDESFDPSASTRKFQTSMIIKQDPQRSGVLFFLSEKISSETPPPTRTPATGVRPGYGG